MWVRIPSEQSVLQSWGETWRRQNDPRLPVHLKHMISDSELVKLVSREAKAKDEYFKNKGMADTPQTNPNGANQYALDPRQKLCWEYYVSPRSETFGNAKQSALKAGYEDTYSDTITVTGWFLEKVRRLNMLSKAEKVLDRTLDLDPVNEEGKIDSAILKTQTDVAKFVASTQGKNEGYSTKTETDVTSGGEKLQVNVISFKGE